MVFGEVEDAVVFGDLQVEGHVRAEAVFPVDVEAEVVDVKFFGFGFVKDAEDGGGVTEVHSSWLFGGLTVLRLARALSGIRQRPIMR